VTMTETWLRHVPTDGQITSAVTVPGFTFTHVPRKQHMHTIAR